MMPCQPEFVYLILSFMCFFFAVLYAVDFLLISLMSCVICQVRAGSQGTLQLFITNSAHVFLVEPPSNAAKLTQAQVYGFSMITLLHIYLTG